MKLNLLLFFLLLSGCVYSQKQIKIIIDPKIKNESLKNINTTDSPSAYTIDSIYQTTFIAKNIVEDTIGFNHLDNKFLKKTLCAIITSKAIHSLLMADLD